MSTSPPTGGQRVIYVQLDHEPEVTHEVRLLCVLVMFPFISATVSANACHLKTGRISYYYNRLLGCMNGAFFSLLSTLALIDFIFRVSP